MPSPHSPASPRARFAGLDGLRAIAVTLVVLYHLFPLWWLGSGFIGVDVFFVISGFLITSLLLREHASNGRIRLGDFWRRRARRLLPALGLVLLTCSSVAWAIGGDVLVGLGRQLVGAATFSYNWLSVVEGADYFTGSGSELFRNLWSLAVEEQFYLLWPVLLPLLLLVRRPWLRVTVAFVLAAASAVWMGVIVSSAATPEALGADITRAYFGTDSHAFGLLLGVAVAVLWRAAGRRERPWMHGRTARALVPMTGAAAVAGLILLAASAQHDSVATFPGTLLLASALSALAVMAGCWPGSWLGRLLDIAPLRWVGDRSYVIYLWHWPVLVLLVASVQRTGTDQPFPVWVGILALVLTLLAAETSHRFVESPVRRLGFRGYAAALGRALRLSPRRRAGVLGGLTAIALLSAGTVSAVVSAPSVSSGQAVVEAGIAALEEHDPGPDTGDATTHDAAEDVSGDQITAIGDSVMLASASSLLERFPGIQIDAAVSRSMYAAPGILRELEAAGALRPYVVLALGTNGSVSARSLQEIIDILGPERQLVLVNAYAPRSWIPGVNADLAAFARAHAAVQVADWADAISGKPELLAGDQIHPGDAGGRVFAEAVAEGVDRAAHARARLAEFTEQRTYAEQLRRELFFQPSHAPFAS
ncbi:acetyltransferase [Microbacterium caowuchunii]|uniref:acyltransferase family protein n=1 Tax=Microbacterium caowuchunii TaxID=2614638 RepID=UPI0012455C63|nr:acyltransferase family protein [Microbacterium caowuchunii]QEV99067.1 acetyltransferase [Microbacterium caowuchunii]